MEGRRLDDGRRVLGVRAGVEVALAVGLLGADQRHVGHQVDEHPRIELDIGVNGADHELPVLEELRQAYALRTGVSKIDLAGDAALEQRQMFRPADARDQEVQVMELCRVDLDERPRKEIRLLLVVTLQSHGVARFEQRLQGLDDGAGLQNKSLHPGCDSGQASGLFRPAARPGVGLFGELNGSIHFVLVSNVSPSVSRMAAGTVVQLERSERQDQPRNVWEISRRTSFITDGME